MEISDIKNDIQIDKDLLKSFENACSDKNIDINTAFSIFMKAVIKERKESTEFDRSDKGKYVVKKLGELERLAGSVANE